MKWFRRLRWPLRDPAIREARDDYREAQALIRIGLERQVEALRRENAQLVRELATYKTQEFMRQALRLRRRLAEEKTDPHPRAVLRREPNRGER